MSFVKRLLQGTFICYVIGGCIAAGIHIGIVAFLVEVFGVDKENASAGIRAMGLSPGTVATQMQRDIKASGINPVSQLEWSDHIPADWPAKALLWMCSADADDWIGQEISLRDPDIRKRVGLI